MKHLGDANLKLSGLAQLGGNTLNNQHQWKTSFDNSIAFLKL